ncbi:hypothetical protein OOK13_43795 [Streptomyces sp. NBC_00378]|uniref:hypothetical protein n=1 Tax=unclassified Streptomyces TaxID=2593676 RepID=UPI002256C81F|nr:MULTISPECIES: hypothetical protein [unclassified Streptomyces]MCX5115252.1 hypothetical protein [Streptomyces sp. NBC_00378]
MSYFVTLEQGAVHLGVTPKVLLRALRHPGTDFPYLTIRRRVYIDPDDMPRLAEEYASAHEEQG